MFADGINGANQEGQRPAEEDAMVAPIFVETLTFAATHIQVNDAHVLHQWHLLSI